MSQEKVTSVVEFIDCTLQVKPGQCHNMQLDGRIFCNLPVFERGGQTVKVLRHTYVQAFPLNSTMGITTFRNLIRMLKKHGE
eukprot:12932482-Ditylum_brightwellii.AAC.1